MSDLEDRLKSWFAGEVERAERDLGTVRVTTARVRRRRPRPGLAVAGLLVALVLLAVGMRQNAAPDAGRGPDRSPATTGPSSSSAATTPAPDRNTVFGLDGIPTVFEGNRVLTPGEAVTHAETATTDRPFLVGGWWLNSGARCAFDTRRVHPLITICGDDSVRTGAAFESEGLAVISPDSPIYDGPIVVQLHTRDPRAATCPPGREERCRSAVVVDKVMWRPGVPVIIYRAPDGLPTAVAGEGTYRAADLGAFRLEPGAFLVAGWAVGGDAKACPVTPTGPSIVVPPVRCASSLLADRRDGQGLLAPDVPLPPGPVVLRVRLLPDEACLRCAFTPRQLAVEEIVWAGDAVTDTRPLTSQDVHTVLRSAVGDVWMDVQPGSIRPGGCDPEFPASTWLAGGTHAVGYLLVFPSVAAREASGGNFRVDGYSGFGADGHACRDIQDVSARWVAVDNVLVQVIADDALAERIKQGLEAIVP